MSLALAALEAPFLLGALLLGVGAALAPVAARVVDLLVPERRVFFARWGFSHAGLVLLVGLTGVVAIQSASPPAGDALGGLYRMVVLLGSVGIACGAVAARREPDGWAALGLVRGGNLRAAAAGSAVFAFALPAIWGAMLLWPVVLSWLGYAWAPQRVLVGIVSLDGADRVQAWVLAVAVLPFLEELCFRGFLQPLLVQNLSDRGGVAATAALFALIHEVHAFLPVFVLSLVMGGIMLRTRRLTAAWCVHALNNALTLAFGIPAA